MSTRRTTFTVAELLRYATCPRSFQLHCVERLPSEPSEGQRLAALFRRTLWLALDEHRSRRGAGEVEPASLVRAYATAWSESGLTDPARFEEGLEVAKAWGRRQGWLDADRLIGLDVPFGLQLAEYRLDGHLDRVERPGDALRVRAYSAARVPAAREDVAASLLLAVHDLAARQRWRSASNVEVELELLRHGSVTRLVRTDDEREATRAYLLATLAPMAAAATGHELPVQPGPRCVTCDHRRQCPAYADAVAGKQRFVGTTPGDLAAVSREREEVARLVKVLSGRKEELEAILRARIEEQGELRVGGMRYALGTTTHTEYPIGPTVQALARVTDLDEAELLDRLAAIRPPALRKLVEELAPTLPADVAAQLRTTLESVARLTFSQRFVARG